MLDFMQKGGPLMWPILFCSVLASAVFFERVLYFHRTSVKVGELIRGLANLIGTRRYSEAQMEVASTSGPIQRVLHAAILRHTESREELRNIVQQAGQLEVPKLERRLAMLATLAFLAPMLGLLGTVVGLMDSFHNMSNASGLTSSAELSSGIYQALFSTAAGLAVCIPTALAYAYVDSRVTGMLHQIERAGIEIVNLLAENHPQPDIIEFDEARQRAEKR